MNIKVFQNRKIEKDYFYNEGTQNENNITVLTFEVPLGYEDFSKRIVFITEDGNFWDYIPENKYEIKNNITKYGTVEAYLWLTKDEQDFRSQKFELNFYENENADNMTPSEEQVDGFNTLIAELELKINEINELKPELDKALKKIENYDTDLQGIKDDIAKRLTEEEAKEIFYTETEVDEMIKEIQETNEYQSEIIDQFKNEFKQITVSGDSIHITDAAELPIDLVPYGEPSQVVIPEELGTTVEGEVVSFSDADLSKETKATINGNTYQEVIEEELGTTIEVNYNYVTPAPSADRESEIEVIDGANNLSNGVEYTSNKNGGTISSNGKGQYSINGTFSDTTYYNFILEKPYTIRKGDYLHCMNEGTLTGNVAVALLNYNSQIMYTSPTVKNKKISLDDYAGQTITHFRLLINPNLDVNITFNPMIVNDSKNKPFLPYGYIGLVQRSKNKFDKSKLKIGKTWNDSSNVNRASSDLFERSGDVTISVANIIGFDFARVVLTNETRTINSIFKSFTTDGNVALPTSHLPDYTHYVIEYEKTSISKSDFENVEMQIEDGLIATPYEPYHYNLKEIDLAGEKLAKATNKDLLKIFTNGNCKITKNTMYKYYGEDTIKGNIPYNIVQGDYMLFQFEAGVTLAERLPILCNRLPFAKNWNIDVESVYVGGQTLTRIQCKILLSRLSEPTLQGIVNWIKENPLEFLLDAPENEVINLPSIEPIELFEGTNILELVTNLDTTMAVTYNYVTPSPSIDRPSEIFTVQGDYETEKQNKNLSFVNKSSIPNFAIGKVKKGKTYTFQIKQNSGTITGYNLRKNTVDGKVIKSKYDFLTNAQETFIADEDYTLFYNGYATKDYYDIQLEVGSTATPFTPHQSSTLPLTLINELLGEIVTLTKEQADALNLDGAGKYVRTDYGRKIMTGDETMFKSSTSHIDAYSLSYSRIEGEPVPPYGYSNYFKYYAGNVGKETPISTITFLNNALYFIFAKAGTTTIDDFKAFLKEKYNEGNPVEVIYKIKEPIYTKITDENQLEQLKAYDKQVAFFGVNNINTYLVDNVNKAPLKIHATYSKSNKLTIQSLEDRLASLESQVTNLQDNQI